MPIRVIRVYERSPIDVKLQHCLEPTIDFFKVLSVTLNFDHFKYFSLSWNKLCFSIPGRFLFLLQIKRLKSPRRVALGVRHIPFERSYFLPWKLEPLQSLLIQNFAELSSICNQNVRAKRYFKDVCNVIVLLTVVTAAPVEVRSKGRWRQIQVDGQVFHSLDCLIPVEHLVRELRMEKRAHIRQHF